MLQSVDLGATWSVLEPSTDHDMEAVWMPTHRTAVAVGTGGAILHGTR
ncbi:MAG: hypothetical protein ACQET1_03645 [Gemmatimonadota bacterium]